MTYDKEFEDYWGTITVNNGLKKRSAYNVWQAARKDHYRIGEEVENTISGERAEIKAVLNFTGSITHINPNNVRRIPAKTRIDEIAEEAEDRYRRGAVGAGSLTDIIKSAILQARKEWEANR